MIIITAGVFVAVGSLIIGFGWWFFVGQSAYSVQDIAGVFMLLACFTPDDSLASQYEH